jgi:hypothetical protein
MAGGMLILAILLAQAPQQARALVPAGTQVRVRFREPIEGGREKVGTVVHLQTTTALEVGGCSVVPAFAAVAATVLVSRPARLFDRSGRLELRFDSLAVSPGRWVSVGAVLDSLEWAARGTLTEQGQLRVRGRSIRGIVGTAGAAGLAGAATGVGIVPVFVLTGLSLVLRGGQAHILAGQRGALRLTAPLEVPAPERCEPATDPWASTGTPSVPPLPPRATDRRGRAGADPINLIFRGSAAAVDTAFARAGWMSAQRSTFGSLSRETEAIVMQSRDSAAPMSHEYYQGRVEDLRFERASPSARIRHHVRLWRADPSGSLWAAAATEDVGMLVSARRRTVTHRIAPDIDRERDLLVGDLLAGGCVALEGYATLPGAQRSGTGVAKQPFVTDARVAVLRAVACAGAGPASGPPL